MYRLTARLNGVRRTATIHANNHQDAMYQAIRIIMDRASKDKTGPWGVGSIRLTKRNETIATMDAK